ncbi:MAG: hypothetical protein JXD23_17380 [Spirochaetales bacterium]|nr:hypothetical protein [Spirochaetales bacterium]
MEYAILVVCLMGAGFFIMYLILRRTVGRWFSSTAQIDKVKEEVERMLVELNHATSRNIDLIEARVSQLKEMLAAVDKRIGLYRREMEKAELSKSVYSSIVKARPPEQAKNGSIEAAPSVNLRDKVLNLYHAGFTTALIANQLQSTIGEVELIISLAEKG